jgi:hypothetical protein
MCFSRKKTKKSSETKFGPWRARASQTASTCARFPTSSTACFDSNPGSMLVFLLEQLHGSPARVPVPPWLVQSVIALAAVIILVSLLWDNHRRATKRGAIQLPVAATANGHAPLQDAVDRGEGGLDQEKDVERDPDSFYPKLRKQKALTTAVTTVLVALELFKVGWDAAAVGPNGWRDWIERISVVIPWVSADYGRVYRLPKETGLRRVGSSLTPTTNRCRRSFSCSRSRRS